MGPCGIGVALKSVGAGQLSWEVLRRRWTTPTAVFAEERAPPCVTPQAPVYQLADAFQWRGPLVATTLDVARQIADFAVPLRLYYVWDFEWLRLARFDHADVRRVLAHPRLRLVARTQEYAEVLERCWNVRVCGVAPPSPDAWMALVKSWEKHGQETF